MVASVSEVQEAVLGASRVLPVGGGTKPALSRDHKGAAVAVEMSNLAGIVDYDPAELTFTARAGTRLAEIETALAEHGQYLPFDPFFTPGGAETLGGTIATGAAGPGAFGAGTVRDFIVGVRIVDGAGRSIAGGGRVVKNAAGFDLPKLMVGSLGRLGLIVQASLKVFPSPRRSATLRIETADLERAVAEMSRLSRAPGRIDALELEPPGAIHLRTTGDPEVLEARVARLESLAGGECTRLDEPAAAAYWRSHASFDWVAEAERAVRVPITAAALPLLERALPAELPRRFGNGLNVAWLAWPEDAPLAALGAALAGAGLRGVTMSGSPARVPLLGVPSGGAFGDRVLATLDPERRFLELGP
jgi:glycolate oxidase FAD binding subunit